MSEAVYLLDNSRSAVGADGSEIVPASLRAVAILFLSQGRNAWHSTWVKTYHVGDFFRDGRKVRKAVEKRKERGTVFYLRVLPGFQFGFGSRKFVVTEINTLEPFRHIDLWAARFGAMAHNLDGFLSVIAPPSALWGPSQLATNRIIVQEVSEDYIDLAAYLALAKGRDHHNNPPIGTYVRNIVGSSSGSSDWIWSPTGTEKPISLRWYNRALEALIESRERLEGHYR